MKRRSGVHGGVQPTRLDRAVMSRLFAARVVAHVWRFQTLPLARRVFTGLPTPCVLQRRFFGYRLFLDVSRSDAQQLLYLVGERFLAERFVLGSLIEEGARIVDVGANIGYYMLFCAAIAGPGGAVHGFEPEPENFAELERNATANSLRNVHLSAIAVGGKDARATLAPGINGRIHEGLVGGLRVPLRRLDSVLAGPVDLINVDVEGYEGQVLSGAKDLLRRFRPALFVEVHPELLAPPFTVAGLVADLGEQYPDLEAFIPSTERGFRDKVAARYVASTAVRRVADLASLLQAAQDGRRREPFWLVCRPEATS